MKIKAYLIIGTIFFACTFGFHARALTSARFLISSPDQTVHIGDMFTTTVAIEPGSTTLDTARLVLSYPKDIIDVVQVQIDPAFMTSPASEVDSQKGTISWGGFTTKGITSNTDFVHIVFRAQQQGTVTLSVLPESLLLASGKNYSGGAKYDLETFTVTPLLAGEEKKSVTIPADTTPPREPVPIFEVLGKEGDKIIIDAQFGTTDEQSGVDHYELMVDDGGFTTVRSPFRIYAPLKETVSIVLRAYDRAGNSVDHSTLLNISPDQLPVLKQEVSKASAQESLNANNVWLLISVVIEVLVLVMLLIVIRKKLKKKK